jgi:hypothetical protein
MSLLCPPSSHANLVQIAWLALNPGVLITWDEQVDFHLNGAENYPLKLDSMHRHAGMPLF